MPYKWVFGRDHVVSTSPLVRNMEFYYFDMATGAWTTTPFASAANLNNILVIALRPNNDIVMFHWDTVTSGGTHPDGPYASVYSICKNTGVATAVVNGNTFGQPEGRLIPCGADMEDDGTVHLWVQGAGVGMFDLRFDPSNNWLSTITVSAPLPRSQGVVSMTYNRTADAFDAVTISRTPLASTSDINFITGSPASNPSYSSTVIDTQTVYTGQMARICISPDRNYPVRYVAYPMGDDGNGYQTEIRLATNSGAGWSNSLMWDFLTDPPPVPSGITFFGLQGVFAASLLGGVPHVGIFGDDFDNQAFSLSWFLKQGNAPPGNLILFDASGGVSGITKPYFVGPVANGSDLWIGMNPNRSVQFLGYFKSTDGGATWAEADAANAPQGTFVDVPFTYSTAILSKGCGSNRVLVTRGWATDKAGGDRVYVG